jgi:hypothetical protein
MGGLAHRAAAVAIAIACAFLLAAGPVSASAPPSPWDGTNPFNCTIQNAGLGTTVPDPGADPYCVQFDKTHQNVTDGGIVDFLSKEPARTASAVPKCFYFQEDHWRGSVVQSDGSTVLYEFQGHYFFNKATGDGGAWVTGFSVAGQTFDPTQLPGFPSAYGQYFGPGTGGVITHDDVPVDPQCVAQAQQTPGGVYSQQPATPRCVADSGLVTRKGLGPLSLAADETTVRGEIGPPQSIKRGFLNYCVTGGGALLVGQLGDRSGTFGDSGTARTVLLLTTARGFVLRAGHGKAFTVGSSKRAIRRAFPHARRLGPIGHGTALRLRPGLVAGLAHGRVRFLATYDATTIRRIARLKGFLRRGA